MAARQLLPHRGTDPHRTATPAARLQCRPTAPGQWAIGRAAARVRPHARDRVARRRPGRCRGTAPLHRRVPDGQRTEAGRAVGHSDHAAPRAGREPAPHQRAGGRCLRRARSGRHLGRPCDRGRRHRPQEPDPGAGRHGALEPAHELHLRRRARAPLPASRSRARLALVVDRAAACRTRHDDRAVDPGREPAAGRRPGVDQQQHRQPAPVERARLARLRRDHERGRARAVRRPRQDVRGDGFCDP